MEKRRETEIGIETEIERGERERERQRREGEGAGERRGENKHTSARDNKVGGVRQLQAQTAVRSWNYSKPGCLERLLEQQILRRKEELKLQLGSCWVDPWYGPPGELKANTVDDHAAHGDDAWQQLAIP